MLDEDRRLRLESTYRKVGPDLWRAVLAFAGGRAEIAGDAVAEAFTQAAGRLDEIRVLRPWLYRAAFRIAAGELKRTRDALRTPLTDTEDKGVEMEFNELLDQLNALSPAQRRVFVIREVFGYPTSETAVLLGSSEVAVRVHLHAARKRLRVQLEREDVR